MINYLGDKFYRYNEDSDSIEMVRIIKIKNEKQYALENVSTKETMIMSKVSLEDDFTKLSPDGYVSFNIVNDNGIKDVIVTLHRRQDLKESNTPFVICRQNALNIFEQLAEGTECKENMTVGCSVNVDTCPSDINFPNFLSCNGMEVSIYVSVYIDDTLDKILSFIKTDRFDNTLSKLKYTLSLTKDVVIKGACDTLKELLVKNDFMWDFRYAFDIKKVGFEINIAKPLCKLQVMELQNIFKHKISDLYIFNYTREIDFKRIKKSYNIVQDINDKLFVIAYVEGDYINESYEKYYGSDDELLIKMKLSNIKKNIG